MLSFSQDEEKNYFPLNERKILKYYFINHQNFVSNEVTSVKDTVFTLTEKIFIGHTAPLQNISNYKFFNNELRILSVDSTVKLPDYKPLNVPGILMKFPIENGKKWEFEYRGIKYKREIVKRHRETIFDDKPYQDVIEIKQITYDVNDVRTTFEYYCYGIGLVRTEALIKNNRIPILMLAFIETRIDSSVLSNVDERVTGPDSMAGGEREVENEFSVEQSGEGKEPAEAPDQPKMDQPKPDQPKIEETKTAVPEAEPQAEDKKKNVPAPEQP
jgi:hypothetical protein